MATQSSRYSFSLRKLLIGVTLLSVIFAWLGFYRGQKVRERDGLIAVFAGSDSRVNFRYTLLGWEVPYESAWLWTIAFPELDSIVLCANANAPLPEAYCEIAQRCQKVAYEGSAGGDDACLRRCVSRNTKEIRIFPNGVSGECLAFVTDCPNLRSVEAKVVTLTTKSLAALLNHPRIEQLEITAEADDLSLLGVLKGPNVLQQLEIRLEFDWRRSKLFDQAVVPARTPANRPGDSYPSLTDRRPSGDFAWLKQCEQLREISISMPRDSAFFESVGRHLRGVERLNLGYCDPKFLESLGTWSRLRRLCLDHIGISDDVIDRITRHCRDLHTLEIDEYSQSSIALSPQGLRSLTNLSGLKRLRLGKCKLTPQHMTAIAQLSQLEELSLEDPGVDDQTIEPLNKLPKLRRISLERTKASDQVFPTIRGDWDDRRPWRT